MAFSNPGALQRLRTLENNSVGRNRRRDQSVHLRGHRRDRDFYSPPVMPLQLLIDEQLADDPLVDDQFDPPPVSTDELADIEWWIRYRYAREHRQVMEEIRDSGWIAA